MSKSAEWAGEVEDLEITIKKHMQFLKDYYNYRGYTKCLEKQIEEHAKLILKQFLI